LAEDDVLDEHTLDLDTPSSCDILNNLTNRLGNLFTALNDILENACANDVAESSLSTLNEGLANIGDAKSRNMRSDNMIVNDRSKAQSYVVLGHTDLLGHLGDLDLDIHLDEVLAERVDLNQTWVDSLVKFAKLGDKTDVALLNTFEGVGADEAAGNGTTGTHNGAKGINC
jgi:hypothetical protein